MKTKVSLLILISFLCLSITGYTQVSKIDVVTTPNGDPLPHAHIKIFYKNSDTLIVSDENGKAFIKGKNEEKVKLIISFMGFKTVIDSLLIGQNKTITLKLSAVTLNSFVVTGQYAENSPEKAVQKITIIDKEKMEKMAAVNLKDVLTNEMNIRLSQDNILGSGMSMQGISGENVKILIDGVPVVGRLNGNIDLSQINLNDIERIEIIEGPMSVNYGTNALAGVINLISKTNNKKLRVNINSYNENIGQYNLDGAISYSLKKHSISVSGGRNFFNGWVKGDPTFGENEKIADSSRYKSWKPKTQYFAKASYNYKLKGGNVKYTFNYFDEKITNKGMPKAPYAETAFDDYYYTKRIDNSLFFTQKLKNNKHINTTLAYNDYKRIKHTYFKDLTTLNELQTTNEGDQDTTKFTQWLLRSTFSSSKDSAKINYEIGIDFNYEQAIGRRIENKKQEMGDYAFYASLEYKPFKNTIIRPGLRYAYNTNYPAPLTPSLNVKQTIGKYNIRASYARGFRSPSLKELYFDFVDINHNIVGNTDLKAETSNNFNLSANYTNTIKSYLLKIELSSFYNKIENLITLAQNEGTQFSYVNIGHFETHGIQLNNNISYKHIKFGIGGSYIGRYNYLSETSDVEKFSYTPEIKSNLNYEFPKQQIFIALFYKYNGKLPGFRVNTDGDISQTYMEAYQIADLSIGKKFWKKKVVIIIGSKNLFDVKSVNRVAQGSAHSGNGTSAPVAMGRTYFIKISFNLEYDKK